MNETALTTVIRRLTELAPRGWVRIVVDCEVEPDDDGDLTTSTVKFAAVPDDGNWTTPPIPYDWDLDEAVESLFHSMGEVRGRRWSTVDLVIDVDGTHRVSFDYSPPRRLGGDLADPRFNNYAEHHRTELEQLAAGHTTDAGPAAEPAAAPPTGPAGLAEQEELIQNVIQHFSAIAPQGWARLHGNWEAHHDDHGTLTLNYITVAIVAGDGDWLYGQIAYDHDLYHAVLDLNQRMTGHDEQHRWTTFDLEIDAEPPAYRVDFDYDPPKRVNGIDDHQSTGRFRDYLQTWIDTHGPTP